MYRLNMPTKTAKPQKNFTAPVPLVKLADVAADARNKDLTAYLRDCLRRFVREHLDENEQWSQLQLYFPEVTRDQWQDILRDEGNNLPHVEPSKETDQQPEPKKRQGRR